MPVQLRESAARSAYLALVQVHEALSSSVSALFKEHELTSAQFNVLRILVQGPTEGCSCQDIKEQLIHRVPDVTRLLDRMEAAGLVRRSRSETDRRVVRVRATARGRKRCEAMYEPLDALHEELFRGRLTRGELRDLDRLLRKVLRSD